MNECSKDLLRLVNGWRTMMEWNQEVRLHGLMCKDPIKSNDEWMRKLLNARRWVYLASQEVKEPKLNQNSML